MNDSLPPSLHIVSGRPAASRPTAARPARLKLDAHTYSRALDCVHCGLCLPACPTYTQTGLEADSPRGRIYLIKALADGTIDPSDSVVKHLDLCVTCQACETACPSGVHYHELIIATRQELEVPPRGGLVGRGVRAMFLHIFPHPTRLKLALLPVRILQKIGLWRLITAPKLTRLLPAQLEKMQQMLPPDGPLWEAELAGNYRATANRHIDGSAKARVGFLVGCVGSVMYQETNRQAIALLQHAGCDVFVPREQVCCGAIHQHNQHTAGARSFMRTNIDTFTPQQIDSSGGKVDYIINAIAGCGAALREAGQILRDDLAYAQRATDFASKVRDITEMLVQLKPERPSHKLDRTVTYHHACHLAHAQKVTEPPLELLGWIDGLNVVPLTEADMCCGAGGTYNLTQPDMARQLAERKLGHIKDSGATICVAGNVGCAMQIQSEADRLGMPLTVEHTVALLHEAYFGRRAARLGAGV